MKIQITKPACCGDVDIPVGEYWATLHSDQGMIVLSRGGGDLKLPAIRRRRVTKSRNLTVQFYCGGGSTWSLLICAPKYGEWISMIELGVNHGTKKD